MYSIDPHVHCRGEEQAYKGETIAHALEVARDSGCSAIFDMPNVQRPVLDESRVLERLKLAKEANVPEVTYGLFVGLTKNPEQIKRAVSIIRGFFPLVVGMKLYAGHSVGDLGVVKLEDQMTVYQTLAREGYGEYRVDGILFVHSEKESKMNQNIGVIFAPENPITHCLARPPEAELASVRDQISLAIQSKFKGRLHIAHISNPYSVVEVRKAREAGLNISCGVCPHHLIYDWNMMNAKDGIIWKMNPPLRAPGLSGKLLEQLRNGEIDLIETDHAPHAIEEKIWTPGMDPKKIMSGITGLQYWPLFEEFLVRSGFTRQQIERVTYDNAAIRFGFEPKKVPRQLRDRTGDYPIQFYQGLEREFHAH